jgi:hypothetical protein
VYMISRTWEKRFTIMINTIKKEKRAIGKGQEHSEINYFVCTCLISTGNAFK